MNDRSSDSYCTSHCIIMTDCHQARKTLRGKLVAARS